MNVMKHLSLIVAITLFSSVNSVPTVYIAPPGGYEHEKLFDLADKRLNEENRSLPFYNLRAAFRAIGYNLKTTTLQEPLPEFAGLIVCNVPSKQVLARVTRGVKDKCIQLLFEPPVIVSHYYDPDLHRYFGKIYTLWGKQVNNTQYIQFFYPQVSLDMVLPLVPFQQRKLCTLIASNKTVSDPAEFYSKRLEAINFFERHAPQEFDLYGHGWSKRQHPCYKGEIESKIEVLRNYKFCICYENSRFDGYITEKIFDCFISGCVPVYCGAPNVKRYIPDNCFIDRDRFANNNELYAFLTHMSEAEYNQYLDAIYAFLQGPQAMRFSQEYFIHTVLNHFVPHYNQALVFTPEQQAKLQALVGNRI